ncbi:hypothetical protein HBA55_36425 [Pseudomaricurvus alkylphenolicus]|uniref:hypothetical protein n=1 Tax=Pseudomaricurvus alkylphenolicus TaxID=1306991 RepID=UPI001421731B|nr:hypothetical protein [Pseudomaricurvus alkylphenolicus]NIB45122.1 hypothetical protein [Pseudomaricurvus alkylphenolicus]
MKSFFSGALGGFLAIATAIAAIYIYQENEKKNWAAETPGDWTGSELRQLLVEIEQYRIIFGHYPETLKDARGGYGGIDDGAIDCECTGDYFYQVRDSSQEYYLLSKGPDCEALTSDDIFPELSQKEVDNIGFRYPEIKIGSHSAGGEGCGNV